MKKSTFLLLSLLLLGQIHFSYAQNQMDSLSNLNEHFFLICDTFDGQPWCYTDIWGYVDASGNEYALLLNFKGLSDGLSVIDISDPANPSEVAFVPVPGAYDVKVYKHPTIGHFAYVQGSRSPNANLAIIDLSGLPGNPGSVVQVNKWLAPPKFRGFHNFQIDTQKGRLVTCSGIASILIDPFGPIDSAYNIETALGGMILLDIFTDPVNPIILDTVIGIRYHDAFFRDDLLFMQGFEETDPPNDKGVIEIYNIDPNSTPLDISDDNFSDLLVTYLLPTFSGSHQAWVSDDNRYMVTDDESIEKNFRFWDIQNILIPPAIPIDVFRKGTSAAHNAYFKGNFCHMSHYSAGYVVLDVSDINNVIEVGSYDTYPADNSSAQNGAFGVYPFFNSCNIIISDMQTGLYVVTFPEDLILQNKNITGNEGYAAKNTITTSGGGTDYFVEIGGESALVASDEIIMRDGFWAKEGSYFHAHIEDPCAPGDGAYKWSGANNDNRPAGTLAMQDGNANSEQSHTDEIENNVFEAMVFPNPGAGKFTLIMLTGGGEGKNIIVTNMLGEIVFKRETFSPSHVTIDISDQSSGVYFLKAVLGNAVFTTKLIYR